MAVPRVAQWAPVGVAGWGGGPKLYVKNNCFIYFLKTHDRILTKLGRNHPYGLGIHSCSYSTYGLNGGGGGGGGHGEAPKGQNHANFKHPLQIQK